MSKDIKLSNVKGFLIFTVVLGHIMAPYQSDLNGIYLTIFSFHMPLFILLNGYFAKRASVKKAWNIVLIYIVFQVLYRCFQFLTNPGHDFGLLFGVPYYHLWYLVSLAIWYLIATLLQKLSLNNIHKILLVLAFFAIGILARFYTEPVVKFLQIFHDNRYDEHAFSYLRTLVYMPFFFIGMFLTEEHMHMIYNSLKRFRWIPILGIVAVFAFLKYGDIANIEGILKGAKGADRMAGAPLMITAKMAGCYIIALFMSYMLLNLISEKKSILTKWGDRTMSVFLFHVFITKLMEKYKVFDGLNKWFVLLFLIITAIIIVSALSSDLFINCSYYLWHPNEAFQKLCKRLKSRLHPTEK